MKMIRLSRRRKTVLLAVLVVLAAALGALGGYRWWYNRTHYVRTNNAQVSAALVPVSPLAAGRVRGLSLQVGDFIARNERVAEVVLPTGGSTPVRAPISGYVAAVWVRDGTAVAPGQPIVTLADPEDIWVTAYVKESQIGRVRPGQPAAIAADGLGGRKLQGSVAAISPATGATFSLIPQQNYSGNFTKVVQWVPVKIALDPGQALLIQGTSVEVSITVSP